MESADGGYVDQRRQGRMAHGDGTRLPFASVGRCEGKVDGEYVLN